MKSDGVYRLIDEIRERGGFITCKDMLDFLDIVERRIIALEERLRIRKFDWEKPDVAPR